MSDSWILKGSIRRVETVEFEAKPLESFGGTANPEEIVDILGALYDIADIEGYVRMDRVENVYFTKSSRLYHTIRFGRTGGYSLVIDTDRYSSQRSMRNCVCTLLFMSFVCSFIMWC